MKKNLILVVLVILFVTFLFANESIANVKASTLYSNKQTTGYAMGATGWGGHTFTRSDVATHPSGYCGDPAGSWPRPTTLTMTSGIAIPSFSGFDPNYDIFWTFNKWDTGDLQCKKNTYWLDIYFSRYLRNGESCTCPGVTTPPNSCYVGASTNSCQSATAYGAPTHSYYGP